MTLTGYFKQRLRQIDGVLARVLPKAASRPSIVHSAMRYSVLGGGKRFRPVLLLACAEALGGRSEDVFLAAAAVELVHTYSLIHDDLPCMDNDDWRRGKLSCHKKFGEAYALLAGDALLTMSFEVLSRIKRADRSHRLVQVLSTAIGTAGMIGGQVVDKQYEGRQPDLPVLTYIHIHKTGQFIRACCEMGAISAGGSVRHERLMRRFGEYLGFAFQVVDDILDGDGYVRLSSEAEAREKAAELVEKAKRELKPLGKKADRLGEMADFVLRRKH